MTTRRFTATTNQAKAAAQRKRELGHIHQGRAALGWSEDDYRYHLHQLTGRSSSADLDDAGRAKVLAHMATLGYKPKASTFKPFTQAAKIQWLWKKIDEHGGLRDASQGTLLAFVARTTGVAVDNLDWLPVSEASDTIEALKAMLDRAKRAQRCP